MVIEELRSTFARFGLPELIVTDNGPCFTSEEFGLFVRKNSIKHVTSAPYHPASNGLAERAVQLIKRGLKKVVDGTLRTRIATVLCSHRITPQATTGVPPSELLLGRRLRTRLDLMIPNTAGYVEKKQLQQKQTHDATAKPRSFAVGAKVYVKNYGSGQSWLPGHVVQISGPLSYVVELASGHTRRCHIDQLRSRVAADRRPQEMDQDVALFPSPTRETESQETTGETSSPSTTSTDGVGDIGSTETAGCMPSQSRERRARRPPDRYEPGFN